ncbi:hypothetical protein [Alteromonas oceanisediminis]|uniref:hypothetical protein n=1 Tax=Alteromonas oceanisediminis TaxID=2836180 RepID=UPI001BDA9DE4|nr:hypothetical protein [Alteromonas oceanisediminis]MBT0587211.1 hypothetical protein [Alteromonas oceanisediminis]
MASLDKEQVIEKFTLAYTKANGKAPSIEAKGGWYSVDGGKNIRLAQLDELADELAGTNQATSKKSTAKPASKPAAKKSKKPASSKGNFSVKAFWNEQIKDQNSGSILPR